MSLRNSLPSKKLNLSLFIEVLKQIACRVAMYSLSHILQFDNIHISQYLYVHTNTRATFLTGDTKVKPCDQTYFSLQVGLGTRLVFILRGKSTLLNKTIFVFEFPCPMSHCGWTLEASHI